MGTLLISKIREEYPDRMMLVGTSPSIITLPPLMHRIAGSLPIFQADRKPCCTAIF